MDTWLKIGFVVMGRVMMALFLGALWGMLLGGACGALCGAIFAVLAGGHVVGAFPGAYIGAGIGALVGLTSGFVASLLRCLFHSPVNADFDLRWRRSLSLMLSFNFIGALAGGFSGALLGLMYWMTGGTRRDDIEVLVFGSCSSYAAGWFYGSISGFLGRY